MGRTPRPGLVYVDGGFKVSSAFKAFAGLFGSDMHVHDQDPDYPSEPFLKYYTVLLIYKVMLVSDVQQSESVVYTHVSTF